MADPKEKKPSAEASAPTGARAGGSKLVLILLALNSLLTAGVLGVVLLRPAGGARGAHPPGVEKAEKTDKPEKGAQGEKGDVKETAVGPMLRLADLVVHLRDTEADRYARVSFDLELATEVDKTAVLPAMPRIRDSIIAYLSDRTFNELRGSEGLEKAKVALLSRVQQAVPGATVKALYISDIVVQ